ncbi:MAG: NfeD family protein, partial [Candidatus Sedimenticola sp. (ex Thyasira tokunagai)]
MSWLEGVTYWQWWVLAVFLIILEVFSPGAFFLWMGVSAGVVGLVLMLVPGLDWEFQVLSFAVFSVISVIAWRFVLKSNPTATDQPALNRRGEQYLDRVFT